MCGKKGDSKDKNGKKAALTRLEKTGRNCFFEMVRTDCSFCGCCFFGKRNDF
jgi:hypothetical protein